LQIERHPLSPKDRPMRLACAIAAATVLLAAATAQAADKAKRIVSLNLCADELVLRLADRDNIASVTWLSRDPDNSNVASLAAQVPVNHGLAEEVIALDPDLVVAGLHTGRSAVALLRRTGFPLIELAVPRSLDEIREQIRTVAGAVGEPQRGERMVTEMDDRLAGFAQAAPAIRRRALVLNPNSFTAGSNSLADKIMAAAGLANLAPALGVGNYGRVPLETVVTARPDLLIIDARRDGPPSWATELLRHPVLAALGKTRLVVLPSRLWTCGGPAVVEAVARLAQVAGELAGEP
jgi:iron complex transport system substrate-binding protein